MVGSFVEMMSAYVGANASHRSFRAGLANAKAVAYILAFDHNKALRTFLGVADDARRRAGGGDYALGMVGRATANTVQMAVHLTGNEIDLINAEPGGFASQAIGLVYREVCRIFETFLIDLFGEIATRRKTRSE